MAKTNSMLSEELTKPVCGETLRTPMCLKSHPGAWHLCSLGTQNLELSWGGERQNLFFKTIKSPCSFSRLQLHFIWLLATVFSFVLLLENTKVCVNRQFAKGA